MEGSVCLRRGISAGLAVLIVFLHLVFAVSLMTGIWPEAPGDKVKKDGKLRVDISNAENGYMVISGPETSKRLKARVTCGGESLYYDLPEDGSKIVVPLQFGSGKYKVDLFKNTSGKKYSSAGSVSFSADLRDEKMAYLSPNQYVDYSRDCEAVASAEQLCGALTTDEEKYEAVRAYIRKNYGYDFMRALTVSSGMLPDINYCIKKRMGICQDLAALACCMLRSQGVPCKLIIGYMGKQYHSWCGVYIDGEEKLYDPTADLGGISAKSDYVIERWY